MKKGKVLQRQCVSLTTVGKHCSFKQIKNSTFCKRHDKGEDPKVLAKKLKEEEATGKYRCITGRSRVKLREYYRKGVKDPIGCKSFKDLEGNEFATGAERLVVGDHGAFIEFDKSHIKIKELRVKPGEEFRFGNNPFVKYLWYETKGGTKVYHQKGTVKYADYKVGKFYVSPKEVIY